MKEYTQSRILYERARRVLAGGVSSAFRQNSFPFPLFYKSASGSRITDVDGNEYIDFSLSQGPMFLGHSHPAVFQKVVAYSCGGQLFAGQHILELELAEKLNKIIPCAELLRFSLSGSEAIHAALRVARAVTRRPRFIRFEGHYHGWFDNVAFGVSGPSLEALGSYEEPEPIPWTEGLPQCATEEFILLPWNDLALVEKTLEKRHEEVAAIITEPVMCNSGCIPPEPGFLEGLRSLCDRYEIALIFDEVITGFRLSLGGAQAYYNVVPDLAVFGKAMTSGYPISVLAGQSYWMDAIASGRVIHAGTMNSTIPTVAAALATLEVLEHEKPYPRLFSLGESLMSGLRKAAENTGQPLLVQGLGPVFHTGFIDQKKVSSYRDVLRYDLKKQAAFVQGMQEQGVRIIGRGLWYISLAHTLEEVQFAISAAERVLQDLA